MVEMTENEQRTGGGAEAADAQMPLAHVAHARAEVLVVDDDPEINQLVGAYAELAGFHYRAAHTGNAALDEVRRRMPRVIVLDLMLPDLDGMEVCRRVKSEAATAQVPVIILTALESDMSRVRGLECGAAEYLTKPFDPDQLMQIISRHGGDQQSPIAPSRH